MAHNDAEIRYDPPKRKEDQIVIYGPDHKIIQVKSTEEATLANLLGDADEGGDEVEEVLPQSQEERIATIRRNNEARRESILASIQLPVWMTGFTRINKFEMVYAQCPLDRMTTVEGLKEKIWMWLTRDQDVVLSKSSVSADSFDEAFEAWGIASMPKLNDMEAKQKIKHSEVNRLIAAAVPKEDPIMSSSPQPVVAESALIPSPTQDPTVGEVQPMVIDQGQSSETVAVTADPVSPLVPRAHARRIKPKRATIIPPPPPPPPLELQKVETTQISQGQAPQTVVTATQGQLDGDAQTINQQLADPAALQADVDAAPLIIDQEMQDETSTVATEATGTSEGLPLAALVGTTRRQRVEEVDAPIARHSAKVSLRGATDFAFEIEARRALVAHRLSQLPNAVGASSYLTEHTHNTAQSQFVLPKQRNFVALFAPDQPKLLGEWIQAPMELKMKLWTTSGQCCVRWTDHYYPKALFRRVDPPHFTNNDVYQVLSSQLGEWSATNVCQDHSLVYVMQSFDFRTAQRGDQEVSANGMSATVGQVKALLAYFGMKETDLNS